MTKPSRGLFFTSIPKAGKNLIYSFLAELDYVRAGFPRDQALWWVEEPWLARAHRRCTYALPPVPADQRPALPGAFRQFLDAVARMGPREVLHHHFPYAPDLAQSLCAEGVPVVFVTRDPRDLLLSMADYILVQKKPGHLAAKFVGLARPALIERLWRGDEELLSLPDYFAAFAGWRDAPGVITLNFESLIGEAGGGDPAEQGRVLRALATSLGSVNEARFEQACAKTFNRRAGTFFKGRKGRWREETGPEVVALLRSPEMQSLAASWRYGD